MRVSRTTGVISGLVVVVLGIWGGLIPFIGPYFHYSFGGAGDTWHYTTNRLWLSILPGAAAVAGGVMMICARHRLIGIIGGWLALAAGAWFVVGAPLSHLWGSGSAAAPIGVPYGGTNRMTLELVGYFYGVGVLIIAFSGFALARFVSRPALVEPVAAESPAARAPDRTEEPITEEPTTHEPITEEPTTQEPTTQEPTTQEPEVEQPTTERPAEPVR